MQTIRAAIFDVDGTLYDYRTRSVLPSTVEALERLRERGIKIIIASGRSYALLGETLIRMVNPDYFVLANGHELLAADGTPVWLERMGAEEVEGLLDTARVHGLQVMLKYHGFCCIYSGETAMRTIFPALGNGEGDYRLCPSWDYHRRELPLGMTIKGAPDLRESLADWEDRLRIEYFYDPSECDVFRRDLSKWTGLERVLSSAGIRAEECIAFGDGGNDVDMLRGVGYGIAMGNGSPEAVVAARGSCPPSWEDGIFRCLKELEII